MYPTGFLIRLARIIHEPRLRQMEGMEGEAVVYHRETRHNAVPAQPTISWFGSPEG